MARRFLRRSQATQKFQHRQAIGHVEGQEPGGRFLRFAAVQGNRFEDRGCPPVVQVRRRIGQPPQRRRPPFLGEI
jgi:hypothetical protein